MNFLNILSETANAASGAFLNAVPKEVTDAASSALGAAELVVGSAGQTVSGWGGQAYQNIQGGVLNLRKAMGEELKEEAEQDEERGFSASVQEELSMFTNLSYAQRLMGFVFCFMNGAFLIFMSVFFVPLIIIRPAKFALSFTLGNIMLLFSTCFLIGPRAQFASMFDPLRAIASTVYLASLLFTLFAAFLMSGPLQYIFVLLSAIIELMALVWYSASYIPYGRTLIGKLVGVEV